MGCTLNVARAASLEQWVNVCRCTRARLVAGVREDLMCLVTTREAALHEARNEYLGSSTILLHLSLILSESLREEEVLLAVEIAVDVRICKPHPPAIIDDHLW